MADTKITDLTALTTPVSGDLLPIVDVSDTSMAATGTDKKVTFANLEANLTVTNMLGLGTGVGTALGINVGTAGAPVVLNGALGTPSSGTLTNANGLPLTGLVSDTTTALGIGSINLGHASDTTIARVSAGVISVEGKTIVNLTDGGTFLADISVPDESYGSGWNGSVEVPTKNAIYDKIETISGGNATVFDPQNILYKNHIFNFIGSSLTNANNGKPLGWTDQSINTTDSTGSFWYNSHADIMANGTNCVINQNLSSGKIGGSTKVAQWGDNKKIYYSTCVAVGSTTGVKTWGLATGTNAAWYTDGSTSNNMLALFVASSGQLKCQTSNNSANTSNNITATTTNFNEYQIVSQLSTNVLFYLNGVLQFTHTTNLPSGSNTIKIGAGMNTSGEHIYMDAPVVSIEL